MNPKIIRNLEDHAVAMARLSALMSSNLAPGSKGENELELLALVIEDFERRTVPPVQADPVEAILFRMEQMKLARKDLVPYIGSVSKVSEVLSRKRPLSLSMIRRLHQGLGIPLDVLVRDGLVDSLADSEEGELSDLEYSRFPLKEMMERGCFGDFDGGVRKLRDRASEMVGEFVRKIAPKQMAPALLRAPLHQRGARRADEIAILAWRLCVLRKARDRRSTKPFKPGTITPEWLRELAKLSVFAEGPRLAMQYLDRHGITLVIEPHFDRTFLDGAAMLDDGRPLVALTLRHDRIDNFWFALLHELAHVGKHLTTDSPLFIDDLDGPDAEGVEQEADAMAREALIPEKKWRNAKVRETRSEEDAIAFAHSILVHPAIVGATTSRDNRLSFAIEARWNEGAGKSSP